MSDRPPITEEIAREIRAWLRDIPAMALASVGPTGAPWGCSVYFAWDDAWKFYFLSDDTTRHATELQANPRCAAIVHALPQEVSEIRGLQIEGTVEVLGRAVDQPDGWSHYRRRFPWVQGFYESPVLQPKDIRDKTRAALFWRLTPTRIVWTDNARGFGFKAELDLHNCK